MKCKKIFDGRTLQKKAKEQIRMAAVQRVRSGESPEGVAAGIGINRRTIYRWLSAYHYGGKNALKARQSPGAPPKLKAKQLQKLATIIRDKNPQQEKFEFALWTLAIVRELIRIKFDVSLSEVSVGRILKRLGFTPQRPLHKAWQQNPTLVDQWQKAEYPKIVERAKLEKAQIFFLDEAGIRSDYHSGTTWGIKGKTPVVKATGARFGLNMISAVNALGHFRFMVIEGSFNAAVFKTFLERLIIGMEKKVFLIVDGHPSHKAKIIQAFIEENKEKIELFFLPPYSPELNPDELTWAHVKSKVAKTAVQTKGELKSAVKKVLCSLQKSPQIVRGFFQTPTCSYIIS